MRGEGQIHMRGGARSHEGRGMIMKGEGQDHMKRRGRFT